MTSSKQMFSVYGTLPVLFWGGVLAKTEFVQNAKTQFENTKIQFEKAKTQFEN